MMKTIYFKNGTELEITQEIANILRDNISKGCKNIQCFSGGDNLHIMIVITEIVYIK